jgi:hypothetical protein
MMLTLDVAWSGVWVIQLVVQLIIPSEHRLYHVHQIQHLLALYVVQTMFTLPLIVYVYREFQRLR